RLDPERRERHHEGTERMREQRRPSRPPAALARPDPAEQHVGADAHQKREGETREQQNPLWVVKPREERQNAVERERRISRPACEQQREAAEDEAPSDHRPLTPRRERERRQRPAEQRKAGRPAGPREGPPARS